MDTPDKVIQIIFLDFRKAFDLIDHNVLLENCCKIGVSDLHLLAGWVRNYVIDPRWLSLRMNSLPGVL